jgi:hypothetical protein
MKRIDALAVVALFITISLRSQGLVNFANTPTTPVYAQALQYNGGFSLMSGPPGSYYFELFFGTPTFGGYTATGIYATNTGVDGLFSGGGPAAVPGWAAGASQTYWVGGWSAQMGHDFNPMWLQGSGGDFGGIGPGSGIAGDGNSIPVLNLFDGGGNTIMGGFDLRNTLIPEPSIAATTIVGAALILLCRKKKRPASGDGVRT